MQSTEAYRDAIQYVSEVKQRIGQSGYSTFLQLLQNYMYSRINRAEVITQVHQLFVGQEELLDGFTRFLPQDWSMENPEQEYHYTMEPQMIR